MSGETGEVQSGWTVDVLRAALLAQIDDLRGNVQRQLDDMRAMLQERYATQTKAVDAAFLAQQTAMQTALSAAEKAVETALLSAEKAVTKAELAADKRFESVNEFRSQLADQAATLISRAEADARITALSEKLDDATDRGAVRDQELTVRLGELESRLTSRLDTSAGEVAGGRRAQQGYTQTAQVAIGALGVLVAVLSIAVVVILASGT